MSLQLSSWTLILLTSERLISVWMPFKCKELCSRRRVIIVWIAIAVVLFGANTHFFFTYDLYEYPSSDGGVYLDCDLHEHFVDFFIGPWYWIDALLGDFIPFTVVFTGNCVIVAKILASKRLRAVAVKDDKGSRKVTFATVSCVFTINIKSITTALYLCLLRKSSL